MSRTSRLPDLSSFELRLLKVFMTVVQANGFTAAEFTLNKSKSAISTDISALESRLGVRLCQRGRSGFFLTGHGKEIYALTQQLFERLDLFRDQVSQVISYTGGNFNVVIDDSVMPDHGERLAKTFDSFKEAAGEVFLNLSSMPTDYMTHAVLDGSTDIAIGFMPRSASEISAIALFEDELGLYCSSNHELFYRNERDVTPVLLQKYELADGSSANLGENANIDLPVGARASTVQSRLMLILTGRYVGWLPKSVAAPLLQSHKLKSFGDKFTCRRTVYALRRRSKEESTAMRLFIDALKDTHRAKGKSVLEVVTSYERPSQQVLA